ncbi:MAG TPA: hypothetical protein VHM26_18080, partial [Chitinophagaceae bacterium]|nr:hypothetical protein [Chitinophagaceae bacterium]
MKQNKIIYTAFVLIAAAMLMTSCKKLALQKDYEHNPQPLDPHVYKTAWEYLKQRALGNTSADSVWKRMYEGILYAEIDTLEYSKPNRTYIFLNNEAITRTSSTAADVGFFDAYRINNAKGTKWQDYPKSLVKAYLQYMIIEGVYDHYTLPAGILQSVPTLAPAGSLSTLPAGITRNTAYPFVANPESKMSLKVLNSSPSNTSDYPVVINENRNVRTS